MKSATLHPGGHACPSRAAARSAGAASRRWHLRTAVSLTPLEAQVLFSSVGAGLSNVGQASYAAANASLDAHALDSRKHGAAKLHDELGRDVPRCKRADLDDATSARVTLLFAAHHAQATEERVRVLEDKLERTNQLAEMLADESRSRRSLPPM